MLVKSIVLASALIPIGVIGAKLAAPPPAEVAATIVQNQVAADSALSARMLAIVDIGACRLDDRLFCASGAAPRVDSLARVELSSLVFSKLSRTGLRVARVGTLFSDDAQVLIRKMMASRDSGLVGIGFLLVGPLYRDSASFGVQLSRVIVDRDCGGCATLSVDEFTWSGSARRGYVTRTLAVRSPIELRPLAETATEEPIAKVSRRP